jgi:hypothetical protein
VAATSQVDAERAALKIEIAAGPVAGLPAGTPGAGRSAPAPGPTSPTTNQPEVTI